MHRVLLLAVAALAPGCKSAEPPAMRASAAFSGARADEPSEIDARTQYELVDQLVAAKGAGVEERDGAQAQLLGSWQGRRFRWQVGYVAAFCRSAHRCSVLPFDHHVRQEPILQGWLPRLELDAEAHADLERQCAGRAACVLTFTGRLAEFSLSSYGATSLSFDRVQIETARPAKPTESWIRRRHRA